MSKGVKFSKCFRQSQNLRLVSYATVFLYLLPPVFKSYPAYGIKYASYKVTFIDKVKIPAFHADILLYCGNI